MYKLVKGCRNISLFFLILWVVLTHQGVVPTDPTAVLTSGLITMILQYIVLQMGHQLISNNKNANNSAIKNGLICAGIPSGRKLVTFLENRFNGKQHPYFLYIPAIALLTPLGYSDKVFVGMVCLAAVCIMMAYPVHAGITKHINETRAGVKSDVENNTGENETK